MKKIIPFIRNEIKNSTVIIIEITAKKDDDLIRELEFLITRWVIETDEGHEAWIDSSGDFNIGDLALVEDQFNKWLRGLTETRNISKIKILCSVDSDEAIEFDYVLVRRRLLPTINWHCPLSIGTKRKV